MIGINEEQLNYLKHLHEKTDNSWAEKTELFNKKFGTNYVKEAIRSRVRHRGWQRYGGSVGNETSQTVIKMKAGELMDEDFILKAHGFDPTKIQLADGVNNYWGQKETEEGVFNLYQTKIKYKPREKVFDESVFRKTIEPVTIKQESSGDRTLIIPIADWHFGITKLSDIKLKLSEMTDIISKGYENIVVLQLGDLFHSSQIKKSVTMNETRLDDVDMEQAVLDCRRFFDSLLTECIKHSKQTTIEHAEGNHSGNLEYMFLIYLEERFPQVKVNYHNKYRTAFLINQVGFFVTHGQYSKKKDLPLLFATEYTDVWAKAKTREIYTGHFHTQQTIDYQGVVHRQLGTIKPNDQYEIENGWTMNRKVIQLFEYDRERLRVTYDI